MGLVVAPRFYSTRSYKWQFGFGPEYEFDARKLDSGYLKTSAISFSGKLIGNLTPAWSLMLRFNIGSVVNAKNQNKVLAANHYSYQPALLYGVSIGLGRRF
ncbi:hypothetical protein [Niabella soli]|nr:hypothetical protein [Niabella soli]